MKILVTGAKGFLGKNLIYRGHPLRRVDNLVYYGSMADKYIIMMQVLDTEDVKDLKLAKRVSIQLQIYQFHVPYQYDIKRYTENDLLQEYSKYCFCLPGIQSSYH